MTITFPALKEAQGKLDAARKDLADVFAEAGSDYDMAKIKSLEGDSAVKVEWIRTKNTEIEDLKSEVDKLRDVARAADNAKADPEAAEKGAEGETKDRKPEVKQLGDLFADSVALKGYHAGQGVGPVAHLDVELKTLFQTSAGWDPQAVRSGLVSLIPTRPAPHVVDFIPQGTTAQDAYLFMEETTFTNNAAEADEGGAYGEAALVLTERTKNVRKVAAWLPVTDEQLEDEPAARDYVNSRLVFMLHQKLDAQVLVGTGAGTPAQIEGTENVTGIQTQALGTDSIPDAIYKLFRQIRDDGFAEPSVVFIRPSKWETVRLLKTADGLYIWGHPSTPGPTTIWGVPVVETTAVTATKAVAGDYANHAFLLAKRGVDVQITNSHSTDFINGKQAVRADLRAVMVHIRPKAFGAVTGL